jgi:hypothetical protein
MSVKVTMSMVVGSVERDEEKNLTKVNYLVSFESSDGHKILFPWEGLKEQVKIWMDVESNNHKS